MDNASQPHTTDRPTLSIRAKGLPAYIEVVEKVQAEGYRGFEMSSSTAVPKVEPPAVKKQLYNDVGVEGRVYAVCSSPC